MNEDQSTPLSLGRAAKLTGVGKSTISRAVARGVVDAIKLEDGTYNVNRESLFRKFPLKVAEPTLRITETQSSVPSDDVGVREALAAARILIRHLEQEILILQNKLQSAT